MLQIELPGDCAGNRAVGRQSGGQGSARGAAGPSSSRQRSHPPPSSGLRRDQRRQQSAWEGGDGALGDSLRAPYKHVDTHGVAVESCAPQRGPKESEKPGRCLRPSSVRSGASASPACGPPARHSRGCVASLAADYMRGRDGVLTSQRSGGTTSAGETESRPVCEG